ncbi:MAG: thioredoxin-dependent thiol peroxidase [Bacteroidota bacterium]
MALEAGDKAPAFSGTDQNGNKISLKDFAGKKLILFIYPEDDTPTCTATACNLRDNFGELKKKGFQIVGLSADDQDSHKRYADKFSLSFPLIADTSKKILNDYEAWGEKNLYGHKFIGIIRKTYIIDEQGVILKIIKKVRADDHTQQILESLEK